MPDSFENKTDVFERVSPPSDDVPMEELGPSEKIGTKADRRDMMRLGKNQELRVSILFQSFLTNSHLVYQVPVMLMWKK